MVDPISTFEKGQIPYANGAQSCAIGVDIKNRSISFDDRTRASGCARRLAAIAICRFGHSMPRRVAICSLTDEALVPPAAERISTLLW